MGPGANAQADQAILSSFFHNIYFWDQPLQKSADKAFARLVDAAEAEVKKLVAINDGSPIRVIAHSFGGHIFHHLSMRVPELLKSCTAYGTGYDIPAGFFKLLSIMGHEPSTPHALKENINSFLTAHKEPRASEMWNYIGLIAQDPAFFRHYWPAPELFSAFISVAAKADQMDMESFQNILNDFLVNHFKPDALKKSPWPGPIEIYFGNKDPLIEIPHESELWESIFPQARIEVLNNSGHFAHLEKYLKA